MPTPFEILTYPKTYCDMSQICRLFTDRVSTTEGVQQCIMIGGLNDNAPSFTWKNVHFYIFKFQCKCGYENVAVSILYTYGPYHKKTCRGRSSLC